MEKLFVNPKIKTLQDDFQLLKHQLKAVNLENSAEIGKTAFHLIINDLWSLLEHGNTYKAFIREDSVKMKIWRLFVVDFIASKVQFQKNSTFFQNATRRNFYLAIILARKFIHDYCELLNAQPNVAEVRYHYFNSIDGDDEEIQQQLINEVKITWFKDMYQYDTIYNSTIVNLIEQCTAAEVLLGPDFWDGISEENIELFLSSLETNHFSEVLFWKGKFVKDKFLKHDKENTTYVFCVQQDETMNPYFNFQTALSLTVSDFSNAFYYDFIYLPFAQQVEQEMIALQGVITASNYFNLIEGINSQDIGGPINYKEALNFAFTILKLELSPIRSGKVVILCNELIMQNLPSEKKWQQAVQSFKKQMNVEIIVLYIGEREKLQPIWFADQIITGEDFTVLF